MALCVALAEMKTHKNACRAWVKDVSVQSLHRSTETIVLLRNVSTAVVAAVPNMFHWSSMATEVRCRCYDHTCMLEYLWGCA